MRMRQDERHQDEAGQLAQEPEDRVACFVLGRLRARLRGVERRALVGLHVSRVSGSASFHHEPDLHRLERREDRVRRRESEPVHASPGQSRRRRAARTRCGRGRARRGSRSPRSGRASTFRGDPSGRSRCSATSAGCRVASTSSAAARGSASGHATVISPSAVAQPPAPSSAGLQASRGTGSRRPGPPRRRVRGARRTSSGVPVCTTAPSSRITTRSASVRASIGSCATRMHGSGERRDAPAAAARGGRRGPPRRRRRAARPAGAAVASDARARASDDALALAARRATGRASGSTPGASRREQLVRAPARAPSRAFAARAQRERDVLGGRSGSGTADAVLEGDADRGGPPARTSRSRAPSSSTSPSSPARSPRAPPRASTCPRRSDRGARPSRRRRRRAARAA